jgi:protein TonB
VEAGYRAQLVAWLAKHKRYPARARAMGLEGQVVLRVTLARDGRVQSHRIEENPAYSVLLHEVEAMVERANPFPAMPATLSGERFELRVPVDFRLREPPARGGS